jgi:hypothetical protein
MPAMTTSSWPTTKDIKFRYDRLKNDRGAIAIDMWYIQTYGIRITHTDIAFIRVSDSKKAS